MSLKPLLLGIFIVITLSAVQAQFPAPYTYRQLSHIYYSKQKDSLKKQWACPSLYKEKETQKKYKEYWDERIEFITGAIESKDYLHDNEVYNYLNQVISDIVKGNPGLITGRPFLLLDRSASVNAYAIGGNIIAVNAGLLVFSNSREEVALVLAHEMAHNILNHPDNSMKERAEWFTSDAYKRSLESVLDSKYERLTRLKKIFQVYSFGRSRHNRYHESDADSLAIALLKNSNISFNPACFLRLDSSDIQYRQPLKNPVKTYFTPYNIAIEDAWLQKRTKGLSTRSYNFKDTTSIADSLKTHPECRERYNKTLSQSTFNGKETPIPAGIREQANKILIWNMFDNLNLTACLYRVLLEKDKGNTDEWYDFMIHNIFSGLQYSDRELNRFNAIGVIPKEYISKEYYELQTMLEQMPRENLEQFCKQFQNAPFWQKMNNEAKALKALMNNLSFDPQPTDKSKEKAAKEFLGSYPESMFGEFADHFIRK